MNQDLSQYQSLNLEDLIQVNSPIVDSHLTVINAISKMKQHNNSISSHYSYILVLEKSKLIGILTERDIVKLTAAEVDLATTTVEEVMTTKLVTIKKSDFADIYSILRILKSNKIRHVPVVNERKELEGIISVESICQALHPSNLLKFRSVSEAIKTDILHAPMTSSVLSLSQMMAENHSSCVIITEEKLSESQSETPVALQIPVGIVTERDIVQLQILGLDLVNTIAQTVMSSPLSCMKLTDSLMEAKEQMAQLGVRRLVIVEEKGEIAGIITQLDMLKVLDPKELFSVIETLQEELNKKTQQLQKEKELAQVTLKSIGDAVITTDILGNIVNFNPMAENLTGYQATEAIGSPLSKIFCIFDEHTEKPKSDSVEQVVQNNPENDSSIHALLVAQDGTKRIIENSITPISDPEGEIVGTVIIFRDVTKSRVLTHRLSWQATHDVLTGLYNRTKFEEKLTEAIVECPVSNINTSASKEFFQHALCYLDLDRFKIINDTCGHAAGDEVLRQVSDIFRKQVRSSDILARLGGDEFGILLYSCPISKATKIADHLRQAIEDFRFTWEEDTFRIGVSIGLTEINSYTENLTTLMNAADTACYCAKKQGRNCVRVYDYH